MMKAGGDSACTRADLQLVRALGRGLCSAVALATWWTPHAGELATLRRLRARVHWLLRLDSGQRGAELMMTAGGG